jgi:hypothetical protein
MLTTNWRVNSHEATIDRRAKNNQEIYKSASLKSSNSAIPKLWQHQSKPLGKARLQR